MAFSASRSSPATDLPCKVDAELVEPFGDEQRVGIDVGRREHLAADGDDLGPHGLAAGAPRPAPRRVACGDPVTPRPPSLRCSTARREASRLPLITPGPAIASRRRHRRRQAPPVKPLEPPRRKRLHHIKHPEEQKAEQQPAPSDWNHEERDQHSHHFVDDDRARIDAAQLFFARLRQRNTGGKQRNDQQRFEIRNAQPSCKPGRSQRRLPSRPCLGQSERSRCTRNCRPGSRDAA